MSRFTDDHEAGVRAFAEILERKRMTCSDCGFEGHVLHGEWETHVESDPNTGHVRYRLRCPDCRSTDVVDVDI